GQPEPGFSWQRYRSRAVLRGAWRTACAHARQPDRPVRRWLAAAGVLQRTGPGRQRGWQPDAGLPRPVQQPPAAPAAADLEEVPLPRLLPERCDGCLLGAPVRPDRPGQRADPPGSGAELE